jgi:hypothetical protein
LIPAFLQDARDFFAVVVIHLTAEGFDEEGLFFPGGGMIGAVRGPGGAAQW